MTARIHDSSTIATGHGPGGAPVHKTGGQPGVYKGGAVHETRTPDQPGVSDTHKLTRTMASWQGMVQTPLAFMPPPETMRRAVVSGTPPNRVLRAARMVARGKGSSLSSAEKYSGSRYLLSCLEASTDSDDEIAYLAAGCNAKELSERLKNSNRDQMWDLLKDMLEDQDVLPKTPDALFEALHQVRFKDTKKLFDLLARAQGLPRPIPERERLHASVDDLVSEYELDAELALHVAKFNSALVAGAQADPKQFQETYAKVREGGKWTDSFLLVIDDSTESAEDVLAKLQTQLLALREEMDNVRPSSTDKVQLQAAIDAVQRARKCWTLFKSIQALHTQINRMYPPDHPLWKTAQLSSG